MRSVIVLLILFLCVAVADGRHVMATTQPAADQPPVPAKDVLEARVQSITFEGFSLAGAIDLILNPPTDFEDIHRNSFVDLAALKRLKIDPATPIKYHAENRKFGDIFLDFIKLIGADKKLGVYPEEDVIVITTPEREAQMADERKAIDALNWDAKTRAQVDVRVPKVAFPGAAPAYSRRIGRRIVRS